MLDPAFARLEDQPIEQTTAWLDAVLAGEVTLPSPTRDDTPAGALLRSEPALPPIARRNVAAAVEALFSQLLAPRGSTTRADPRSTPWVRGLCELVVRLRLEHLGWRVPELVADAASFDALPFDQRVALLHIITDLRCPVRPGFWQQLTARDPDRYAILSVSALFVVHPTEAVALLPALPDDARVGEALQVLWRIRIDALSERARAEAQAQAVALRPQCRPAIREALGGVLGAVAPAVDTERQASSSLGGQGTTPLREALLQRDPNASFEPAVARLLAA
jgi:hypothetical protein